ncbi:MAG: alternative ribosome rescue aminoacyl-tRNA hydrolase ArfB [Lentilitoribacter sp.]
MVDKRLYINDKIMIEPWELVEQFIHSAGPGGQNVNKVATSVQLRFDLQNSPSVPQHIKTRAIKNAGRRINKEGVIVLEASKHRSQERNREDARNRLKELLIEASKPPPPPRRKTKPTRGSIERRLKAKANRSGIKKMRNRVTDD